MTPTPIIEHPPVVASSTPEETPRLPDCGRSLAELREPHLRGRRAERQLLWQALLDVCAAGRPAAVVIEGSAGMGKSRLAEWLTRRAHQAGRAETLRATHQPDPGAASGVGPMLVRHLRLGGLDGPARGRRLAGLGHGSDTAALLAALDPDGVAEVDGRRVQLSRADARAPILVRAIERMAAACPHIFVVDDAHWGPGAVDIAHRLLDRGRAPLLLVLTCRRHRLATLERLTERAEVQRLRLDPLPAEAIGAIAEDRVLLDPGVRRRLVEHVGGNPSFASEMVRHWLESDLLVPGPAGHGLRSDAALIVEPTALWSARLARAVADGSRRAPFCIAAALGLEVDEGEWRAVCARAGAAVVEADVEALFDASLARPSSDGQWAFVHAGLRSALLEQAVDLPAIHQHCAAVLSARTGVDTRRIAAHLEAAGDLEAAFDSWLHAWRITRRRAAADEGRRCLLAAARICRRLGESADGVRFTEVRVWWALMASNTGAVSLAQRHADRALRDARRRGDGPQITRALMLAGQTRANTDSAASIALLREAHARSASLEPDLASTCARWLCDQLLFTGDPVGARRILDDATRRARAAGDASALAYVALRRAELASLDGDLDGAERAAVEARAAFEASGDRFGLAHAGMVRGLVARDEGRYADAVAAFESARDTFRRMGHHNIAVAECNLSQVLLADGRVDAARAAAERGRAAAIEMRNDVYRVMAEMSLLPTLAQAGDAGAWDGCWAALVTLVPQVGLALVDAGEALADAGRRAELNGWSARAGRARAMAIAQFEGAGCPERAAALRLSTR